MLLVFIALVSLANQLPALLPHPGTEPLTLQTILGYLMAPIVFLMGIPPGESVTAGSLMGVKMVMNEFLAYLQLVTLAPEALSERSRLIMKSF